MLFPAPRRAFRSLIGLAVITLVYITVRRFQLPDTWTTWAGSTPRQAVVQGWPERAHRVRNAFVHAYDAYEQYAFPHDELKPLSIGVLGSWVDNYNGWGVTAVDALDTMVIMGLDVPAQRVIDHIATLKFDNEGRVHFFETTIRYLGGLLSAYALTRNPLLLSQADILGHRLMTAFNTKTGLPAPGVDLRDGQIDDLMVNHVLSEIGSCQLEFRALAHFTGKIEYARAVDNVTRHLQRHVHPTGMFPTAFSSKTGVPTKSRFSVGGDADSAYEYLLKGYLQTNYSEPSLLESYLESASGAISNLLLLSPTRSLLYVTDSSDGKTSGRMEHLSCFFPGTLALAVHSLPASAFPSWSSSDKHMLAAEGLAETCYQMYKDSPIGLSPDEVRFAGHKRRPGTKHVSSRSWADEYSKWNADAVPQGPAPGIQPLDRTWSPGGTEWSAQKPENQLRPEAIESMYMLWRTTGDSKWRNKGWAIFEAIDQHARLEHGFASIKDAMATTVVHGNDMPSWFLAETLKYAYLLCLDEDPFPSNQWIFNTEAHPLPVFEWSEGQRAELDVGSQ